MGGIKCEIKKKEKNYLCQQLYADIIFLSFWLNFKEFGGSKNVLLY